MCLTKTKSAHPRGAISQADRSGTNCVREEIDRSSAVEGTAVNPTRSQMRWARNEWRLWGGGLILPSSDGEAVTVVGVMHG